MGNLDRLIDQLEQIPVEKLKIEYGNHILSALWEARELQRQLEAFQEVEYNYFERV